MKKNREVDELPKALQNGEKEPIKKQTGKQVLMVLIILAIIGTSTGGLLKGKVIKFKFKGKT